MNRVFNSNITKAVYDDDLEELQFLLELGKRVDLQDNLGWNPLHAVVSKNRLDMLELLLSHPDAPINARCYEGQTPLFLACMESSNKRLVSALLIAGADPNIPNNEDMAPLHVTRDPDVAELLLTFGANANAQDFNKYTALHCAVERDSEVMVEVLVSAGADTSLRECNGLNPLMLTFQDHFVCTEKLLEYTEDINAIADDGWSTLMLAINAGQIEIAYKLLKRGANVNITAQNLTPLHLAVMRQEVELFEAIWPKINYKMIKKSHSFPHLMLIHRWYVPERIESFFKVLNTRELYTTVAYRQNFLGFLFRFELDNKLEVVICEIVSRILNSVSVNSIELVSFIENFDTCRYKFQILDLLYEKGRADFDQSSIVLLATEFDPELVPRLLNLSLNTSPSQVFRFCTNISRNDAQIMKLVYYILSFCTPTNLAKSKFLQKLKNLDVYNLRTISYTLKGLAVVERVIEVYKVVDHPISAQEKEVMIALNDKITRILSTNTPPSLTELSRDCVRGALKRRCGKMRNCDSELSRLGLPHTIIDIIKLKQPVYNYL